MFLWPGSIRGWATELKALVAGRSIATVSSRRLSEVYLSEVTSSVGCLTKSSPCILLQWGMQFAVPAIIGFRLAARLEIGRDRRTGLRRDACNLRLCPWCSCAFCQCSRSKSPPILNQARLNQAVAKLLRNFPPGTSK